MVEPLFGLGVGIFLKVFNMFGIEFVFSEVLNIFVRKVRAQLPKCFKCLLLFIIGPF